MHTPEILLAISELRSAKQTYETAYAALHSLMETERIKYEATNKALKSLIETERNKCETANKELQALIAEERRKCETGIKLLNASRVESFKVLSENDKIELYDVMKDAVNHIEGQREIFGPPAPTNTPKMNFIDQFRDITIKAPHTKYKNAKFTTLLTWFIASIRTKQLNIAKNKIRLACVLFCTRHKPDISPDALEILLVEMAKRKDASLGPFGVSYSELDGYTFDFTNGSQ